VNSGIVTFPSFHVVLALLPVLALWPRRVLRPFLALVSAAICLSTLTTGWHYATDGIGGLVVTILAYWIAGKTNRWLAEKPSGTPAQYTMIPWVELPRRNVFEK
jgi:membrane-associated phospholipid phosphatase